MTESYSGAERLNTAGSEYNAMEFIVRAVAGRMWTSTLVIVRAVGDGTVDVQPMVHQIDGNNAITEHGTIHGLPVWRLQGGTGAVIVTPVAGDIGLALFAREDTSVVRKTKAPAGPGSRRRYDPADGIYMGGLWGMPTRTLEFTPDGTVLTDPTQITVNSPLVTLSQDLKVTGDIMTGPGSTFNGKSFDTHTHSGVQAGSANSGPPV